MQCSESQFVKGQLLDARFLTVAPLNHGSFGMVFLAKDIKTGQDVAIKCMAKSPSDSLRTDERFEELASHRCLGYHPNIVNLVHSFETKDRLYLVLEYCANGDLYEAIRLGRGPLETGHVRDFMLQLISAVEFMHASGLYHRDIKPENIFLMQDGSVKLGDFGLATPDVMCQEACVGSDRYMAPEQYEPPPTGYCTAKADIWAIGICLLNVLFGRNPFSKPVESDVIFADYARDRQSLFDVFPNMSQDTYEILTHALAFDPEKRSFAGISDAILRAVSFTTDDDALDEFCIEDNSSKAVLPGSADREPLKTPSIQSSAIQGECFPWAKALQSTPPQPLREPSSSDSYSEDLFPASETAGTSWFSLHMGTPSKDSLYGSTLCESYKSSAAFPKQQQRFQAYPPPSDPVPITGSLPSGGGVGFKPLPSLSMVFGKNKDDQISKSWSDLWDEEESENEDMNNLEQRRMQNSRSWSQESDSTVDLASPPPRKGLHEPESGNSFINQRSSPVPVNRLSFDKPRRDSKSTVTGSSRTRAKSVSNSTPAKNSSLDKWAALGDRRRNYKPSDGGFKPKNVLNRSWRKDWGLGSSGFDYGSWVKKTTSSSPRRESRYRSIIDRDWRRDSFEKTRPQMQPRTLPANNSYDGSVDEDLDLFGGWHDLHL